MSRVIEILVNDGSPLGVTCKTVWNDGNRIGVGGAELALLTMCEEWQKAGHEVILYNDPHEPNASPFTQKFRMDFDVSAKHDILITFRSPNLKTIATEAELKVWWSCDQYTVDDFGKFASEVDKIVCISPFHADYFKANYQIENTIVIDLPVRVQDYELDVEKIDKRFLFSSVPDRGLRNMWRLWRIIAREVSNASLVITSDYRLWGTPANNQQFRAEWMLLEKEKYNVQFSGALPRERFIEEQLKTDVYLYPCNYDELFCIACSEAQYAGAYPITSSQGALMTTNMGKILAVDPNNSHNDVTFVDGVLEYLNNPYREQMRKDIQQKAAKRFHPQTILDQWEDKVFS